MLSVDDEDYGGLAGDIGDIDNDNEETDEEDGGLIPSAASRRLLRRRRSRRRSRRRRSGEEGLEGGGPDALLEEGAPEGLGPELGSTGEKSQSKKGCRKS